MKNRKMIAIMLSCTLIAAMLAGCGTKDDSAEAPVQEGTDVQDDTEEVAQEAEETELPVELEEPVEVKVEMSLIPDDIIASSELEPYPSTVIPNKWFTYYVSYVDDRNLDTAWNEGADGDGVGEYIDFYFPDGTEITGGLFFPGFYLDEELFFQNNAVTSLELSTGDQSVTLDTTEFANSYSEDYTEKEFTLDEPLIVQDGVVRATIKGVRMGNKYNDACISELSFKGYPVEDGQGIEDRFSYIRDQEMQDVTSVAGYLLKQYISSVNDYSLESSKFTSHDKAFILYWYQYHCSNPLIQNEGEFNVASKTDLLAIMEQLFPNVTDADMQEFCNSYVDHMEGDMCYMYATGDFGDAGAFYLENPVSRGVCNGRLKVVADVNNYRENGKQVVIWMVPYPDGLWGWYIDEIVIEDMDEESINSLSHTMIKSLKSAPLKYLDYTYADYKVEFDEELENQTGQLFVGPTDYKDVYVDFRGAGVSDDDYVYYLEGTVDSLLNGVSTGDSTIDLAADMRSTYGNVDMFFKHGGGSAYSIAADYVQCLIDIEGDGTYDYTVQIETTDLSCETVNNIVWIRYYDPQYDMQ